MDQFTSCCVICVFIFLNGVLCNESSSTSSAKGVVNTLREKSTSVGEPNKYLYFGTYTKNIHIWEGTESTGWTFKNVAPTVGNPSFIVTNRKEDRLYAINELSDYDGQMGFVSAFIVDSSNGNLTFLNSQESHGNSPAHLTVDPSQKFLLVANYGSGNVIVFRLQQDGSIGDKVDSFSAGPTSRAHMVTFDPHTGFVAAVFLGLDAIYFFTLNENSGKLQHARVFRSDSAIATDLEAQLPSGSGPRHLVYGQRGDVFYIINEFASTVATFTSQNGTYNLSQVLSTLPTRYKSKSYAGEIALHPSGNYVYATNRGHDSVVSFSVNQTSGYLTTIDYVSSNGSYPRHLLIDDTGKFLIVANQKSGGAQFFHVDNETGHLSPGQNLDVPSAACSLLVAHASQKNF